MPKNLPPGDYRIGGTSCFDQFLMFMLVVGLISVAIAGATKIGLILLAVGFAIWLVLSLLSWLGRDSDGSTDADS